MEQNDPSVKSIYQHTAEFVADPVKLVYGIQGTAIDSHLQHLVRMVNNAETDFSFGITLFTSAGVVTGSLISRKKYFEKFGQSFKSGFDQSFPDTDWQYIADSFAAKGTEGDDLPEGDEYECPPQFVHLDGASLLSGDGSLIMKSGILWRGKLQAVTGFTLGTIS